MRHLIAALGVVLYGCAMAAAASPVPEALVLTKAAPFKNRPTANGTVLRRLGADAELRPVSFVQNAAGLWVFARTGDGDAGWARMQDMKGRGAIIPDARTLLAWSAAQGVPAFCLRGKIRAATDANRGTGSIYQPRLKTTGR